MIWPGGSLEEGKTRTNLRPRTTACMLLSVIPVTESIWHLNLSFVVQSGQASRKIVIIQVIEGTESMKKKN